MATLYPTLYTVEVRDQYGRLVTVLSQPQSKQFALYRNKAGSCQFVLDLYDPQATLDIIRLNQYDIVFRRQGTPVFAGQISYIEPSIDGDKKQVEIIATGYFDLFDQRYITPDYPNYDALNRNLPFAATDGGLICWNLIDSAQFPLSSDTTQTMSGASPTFAQSFIAQGTANVTTIKMLLQNVSATDNMVVGIYNDFQGGPSTLVANSQKIVAVSGISSTLAWYEIDYSGTLPALTNGTTYWLRAYLDTAQSGANGIKWSILNPDPITGQPIYLNGKAYSPESPSLFTTGQNLQFFCLLDDNSFQMTKNTYWGITQGVIQTSFTLTPTFSQFKKIKSCIEDISSAYNGIDFNISVSINATTNVMTKSFNIWYPKQGVDNTSLLFYYPYNIKKIKKQRDGKAMENEVTMRGQGYGTAQVTSTQLDSASIQSYSQRQDTQNQSDVSDQTTLDSIARETVRVRKDPVDLPDFIMDGQVPPHIGDYGVGDTINVFFQGIPMLQTAATYRIEQIAATISDDDQEEAEIIVSAA